MRSGCPSALKNSALRRGMSGMIMTISLFFHIVRPSKPRLAAGRKRANRRQALRRRSAPATASATTWAIVVVASSSWIARAARRATAPRRCWMLCPTAQSGCAPCRPRTGSSPCTTRQTSASVIVAGSAASCHPPPTPGREVTRPAARRPPSTRRTCTALEPALPAISSELSGAGALPASSVSMCTPRANWVLVGPLMTLTESLPPIRNCVCYGCPDGICNRLSYEWSPDRMSLVITGASGNLGRRTAELLLDTEGVDAADVVLITRNAAALDDLAARGATVRQADFREPSTLPAAFAGARRVLIVSTDAVGARIAHQRAAIDAAKAAGATLIAYTSIGNPTEGNAAGVVPDHRATEEALKASGVAYTMLRNALY